MHSLVKEQKKSIFTVPFLGPSGGTKNETAKSQNQQQRPTRPNKNYNCVYLSKKHIDLEQYIYIYQQIIFMAVHIILHPVRRHFP